MSFDATKVDLILQYALLLAGQEDDYFDRQLGPIHLIKYVYLADLAFARRNHGETYTGVDWRFYQFGPWSQAVNARIEPALGVLQADYKVFESDYGERNDWVRWNKRDYRLLGEIEKQIPPCITVDLRQNVHKFLKDTPALLDFVYKTKPMLSAAPNEVLDFSLAIEKSLKEQQKPQPLRMETLSAKKQKKFQERMKAIREKSQNRGPRRTRLVRPANSPIYDEVYRQGMEWLDSLAGPELSPGEKVAEFSDEVWKSSTRKGEDVS